MFHLLKPLRLALAVLTLCVLILASGCRRAPAPPPFDVPALIGLPMDALTRKLGAPTSQQPTQKTWARPGATLAATYKPLSGRVTELTLTGKEAVRDGEQKELLQTGQLKPDDARYSVDYLESPDETLKYNGVRIVPAPRTYQVQVRVSGPPDMLQISYAMSGATPSAETFITFAPWDKTATLPDNAQIQLSARTTRDQIAQTPILAEIVVDGKVVATSKVSVVASCSWEL